MPLDVDIIGARLARLEKCVRKLKEVFAVGKVEFLKDEDLQDRAERNFQIAAQCCLDIGSHIVAGKSLGMPESYTDIFRLLGKAGVLPQAFADDFAKIAGFRNILVHDYIKVDPEKVFANLARLSDFDKFSKLVVDYLEQNPDSSD